LKADLGRRSLELRKLLRRFIDVCNAIDYAHSRGVLHRDVKPGNVIVGRYGETLVVDWGLAKATGKSAPAAGERTLRPSSASGSAETLPGSALGTPAYMSPEQAEGNVEALGPRSDVYSLGATLYCLLTGRPPVEGDDIGAILRAVQRGEFTPPRRIDLTIDRALEAVCLQAMALRPEDRYGSCRALAEDIERWMADEPVTAWREPVSRRVRRWMRRNRTAVAAAVVALVAGVVGLGAVAGVQARANSTLRTANKATEKALGETQEAKKATEAALAESEESRRQAKAINDFLTEDLLTQAEPANSAAEDHVSLLEVLDRAATKVSDRFAGQPEVEDALRRTIAGTYHGLGSWEKAERQWRAVLQAARRRRGPESPEAFRALDELAHTLRHRGRLDAEVLEMAKSASDGLARVLGPEHRATLTSRNNLALAYQAAGRTAEAIALDEVTLKVRESKLGPDHPDTLTSRNNLALDYESVGRIAEAIKLHEATLKASESKLGPDHPDTLITRDNLAVTYLQVGRTAEAIKMHEATLKASESKLGPDHPDTLISRGNLAKAYRAAGQLDRAVSHFEQALKGFRATLGPDHPFTLTTEQLLADAYIAAGQHAKAEPVLREYLSIRAKAKSDDWITFNARSQLGGSLLAQDRFAEAEPLILQGYEGLKDRKANIPAMRKKSLAEAAARIVRLYECWGKPDQAAAWKAKLGLSDLPESVFAP
jgi:tetratricopeptide (TPR) repeat protein